MSSIAPIPLSNDGSEAINRSLESNNQSNNQTSLPDVNDQTAIFEYFQINDVISFIQSIKPNAGSNKVRVALQMQDLLLPYACDIVTLIEKSYNQSINQSEPSETQSNKPSIDCYVLADTAYSPCCVDTIAAAHCSADCLIHFGIACLTRPNTNIPCFHVFGRAIVDQTIKQSISQSILQMEMNKILVFADLEYQHILPELKDLINQTTHDKVIEFAIATQIDQSSNQSVDQSLNQSIVGHQFKLDGSIDDYSLLFIGHDESALLRNLALNTPSSQLSFLDIDQSIKQSIKQKIIQTVNQTNDQTINLSIAEASLTPSVSRTLARRYYLTQKATSSNVIGLLVGSLASESTRPLIVRLKNLIRQSGKRCYVVTVGQINEAKLSNFPDIDIWCLFACPLTCLIDSQYWHKDVVTAWEMDAVLTNRVWDGRYSTQLSNNQSNNQSNDQTNNQTSNQTEDEDELHFDSLTGKLRPHQSNSQSINQSNNQSTSLIPAYESSLIERSIIDHQSINRTFNGLETREEREARLLNDDLNDLSDLKFSTVQQGLSGIASKYSKETS